MGCVNCKPTKVSPNSSSERPSRAQKTIEKRKRKSVQSLLRAILFAKKSRSSSKIAPEVCSSSQGHSLSSVCCHGRFRCRFKLINILLIILQNTTTSHSAENLHEIFCGSISDSFCVEVIPVGNDPEIIENDDTDSDFTSDSGSEESGKRSNIGSRFS